MKRSLTLLLFCLATSPLMFAHDVQLSCTAGTGGGTVTGFIFKRATVSGGPYITLNSTPLAACSLDDATAAVQVEGQKFFYVVAASGPGGVSPDSQEASATIPFSAPATPSAPTAVPK